jgi:ankyrin repeat protein
MPIQRLPDNPSLEQMKNQAKTLQDFVRAEVPQALEMAREFYPRPLDPAQFKRSDAQLVVARRHGFPSWPKLKTHLEVVARYSRSPHLQAVDDDANVADRFLVLACLTHGDNDEDDPARWREAAELLTTHPELTSASPHAAAAAGDVEALRRHLDAEPSSARREGGPHQWEPLLYLAYAAVDDGRPGCSHVEAARLLLDAGADPDAGYLWEGLPSPYTALTGALSSNHKDALALGRLILERGANANDSQALYELGFIGDDPAPIELLFEFGLGRGDGGVWHRRLAPRHPTPSQLVEEELVKAASSDWPRRAGVVLAHPVDIHGTGDNHPIFEGRGAYELALVNGSAEVVAAIEEAKGGRLPHDAELDLLGAAIRADHASVDRLRATDPDIVRRAKERRPHQVSVAADRDRLAAVKLLVELGFDVNASWRWPHDQTALHGAAFNGNLEMVRYLVANGADPKREDCSFHATPRGWAEHNDQTAVVEYLDSLG